MVARDGIEPPPPAFSGLLTDNATRFRINGSPWQQRDYTASHLGWFRIIWAIFAPAMFPYCSRFGRAACPMVRQLSSEGSKQRLIMGGDVHRRAFTKGEKSLRSRAFLVNVGIRAKNSLTVRFNVPNGHN